MARVHHCLPSFLAALALSVGPILMAHDGMDQAGSDNPTVLFGAGKLSPPEGAADQDASGSIHLKQRGDRNAIHIHVRNLEPGAAYDVQATKGEVSEKIGSITTHDGMPPPPRCFKAKLAAPAEEGDGAGGIFWHRPPPTPAKPGGCAIFNVNKERTQLRYWIGVRGVEEVASATLKIGDASIELDAAELHGTLDVTAEQLAALAAGEGSVTVKAAGETGVELTGDVETCFEGLRERLAAKRAGRGTLRIDTARGDKLPLEALTIADLAGVTFAILNGEGAVVLSGSVAELNEGHFPRNHDGNGDGGGGAIGDDRLADSYFGIEDVHDATFVRGDANDDGAADVSDAVFVLGYLFMRMDAPYCLDAADANDNGEVEISDPVMILLSLFHGTAPMRAPYPEQGFDSTADDHSCLPYSG